MTTEASALHAQPLHITDTALSNFEFNAFNALPSELRLALDPRALLEKLCARSMARADRQEEVREAGKLAHVLNLGASAADDGLSLGRFYGVVKPNTQRAPPGPTWALVTVVAGSMYDQSLRMGLWRPTAAQPRKPKRERRVPEVMRLARPGVPAPMHVDALEPDSVLGSAPGAAAGAATAEEPADARYLLAYLTASGAPAHRVLPKSEVEKTIREIQAQGAKGFVLGRQVPLTVDVHTTVTVLF